jgi:CTP:molybdopterin cytidylyltransferase MocA
MIGVVLAAGHGRRLGGPKALVLFEGAPLVLAHTARLFEAGCRDVVVVVRAEVAPGLVLPGRARVALSSASDQGGSLSVGLREIATADEEPVVISLVDVLPARVATLCALVAALDGGAEAATPRRLGVSGHPVVARARVLRAYRSESVAPPRLCDVLDALGPARVRVSVEDGAVTSELDCPADAQRVLGHGVVFADASETSPPGESIGRSSRTPC